MFSYEITSPTQARNDLFSLLKEVADHHQVFLINRQEGENVALIAESELQNLVETVYLLRSPLNARRLFDALEASIKGDILPQSLDELKRELEIE